MTYPEQYEPAHAELLFIHNAIKKVERPAEWKEVCRIFPPHFLLLVFAEGQGKLYVEDKPYSINRGDCFLLTPNQLMKLHNTSPTQLSYYEVGMQRIQMKQDDHETYVDADFPYTGKLHSPSASLLMSEMDIIYEGQASSGISQLKNYIRFQELLLSLFEQTGVASKQQNSLLAVEKTIDELQRRYHEPITIEQLAAKASIGIWQYRQLFKRITGINPNEYLTELRINRAKELLLVSNDSLDHIARSIGYQDGYYFNRRFTKSVGVTPRQYMQRVRSQIRVAALSHFGDMMSLGIQPIAADYHLLQWLDKRYTKGIESIEMTSAGLAKMAALRPDLILVNPYTDGQFVEELKKIAPTITLEIKNNMFQNLKNVAEVLGRQYEAKAWLSHYRNKAKQVKEHFHSIIGKKETAVFFHVVNGEIYLCRPKEVPVLYEVLGFEVPDSLKLLMHQQSARLFIPIDSFPAYTADHIFITHGYMTGAKETYNRIISSPQWQSQPAVQNRQHYYVNTSWTLDGTIALDWQLEGITELLANGGLR